MKKRIFAWIFAVLLCIGLTACREQAQMPQPTVETPTPVQEQPDPRDTTVQQMLAQMTLEQKAGQLFLARCPENGEAEQAQALSLGGYVLFARDFEHRTKEELRELLQACQADASIPMLMATDEEGGTVVRASKYPQYRDQKFRSPQQVYAQGGMDAIVADAAEKAQFLKDLGLNVDLAPVCDVSTDAQDFMYARAFGQPAAETAEYVAAVVQAMQNNGVGTVLKHFPGYGSNADTHTGAAVDSRSLAELRQQDFLPFAAGIDAGADCILVSHTSVEAIDAQHPASMSAAVYQTLRQELQFDGVALTDDLAMQAITGQMSVEEAAVNAVLAGCDLVLSSDAATQVPALISAVQNGIVPLERIDEAVTRVLRWKYDLGLLQPQ